MNSTKPGSLLKLLLSSWVTWFGSSYVAYYEYLIHGLILAILWFCSWRKLSVNQSNFLELWLVAKMFDEIYVLICYLALTWQVLGNVWWNNWQEGQRLLLDWHIRLWSVLTLLARPASQCNRRAYVLLMLLCYFF